MSKQMKAYNILNLTIQYFQCILALLICAVNAGLLPAYGGIAVSAPAIPVAAPVAVAHAPVAIAPAPVAVAHAPVAVAAHGAVSYQNSNLVSVNPSTVAVRAAAPVATVGVAPYGGYGYGMYNSLKVFTLKHIF